MLQAIHDRLTGIFAIIILVVLGVVFTFWGVDASVGTFTQATGVEVNGIEVGGPGIRQAYQNELARYQQAFGAAEVPEELRKQVQDGVLERAIQTELVRQRTVKLRYASTDEQILAQIQEVPAFQVAGRFSKDAYHAALRSAAIEPASFEAEQRSLALARQLNRALFASSFVMPSEFDRRIALLNEVREVAWVRVPAERFLGTAEPDDAALEAFYRRNLKRYMTEETARLEYLLLDINDLAGDVKVSEADLQAWYEEQRARYATQERRRARHILVEAGSDAAAGEARAQAAYERARAGEDFAALARELSADAGSAAQGGDLGWAERSAFVGPFADAVWAMQPGEIRGPVSTTFGWHVIRLEEVEQGQQKSLEEVRAEIEPEIRRTKVERLFGDLQEKLDTEAFEAAGNLEAVAQEMSLPVRVVERFTRAGGEPLGGDPALVEAVFATDTLSGRELRTVELDQGRVVALRVAAHQPPRERGLNEVRTEVLAAARLELAQARAEEQAAALVKELRAGADWPKLSAGWAGAGAGAGAGNGQAVALRRSSAEFPAEVVRGAFRAPEPSGSPRYGSEKLGNGDAAVWRLSAVRPGAPGALSQDERQQVFNQVIEGLASQDTSAYLKALRAKADIDVNEQLFQ